MTALQVSRSMHGKWTIDREPVHWHLDQRSTFTVLMVRWPVVVRRSGAHLLRTFDMKADFVLQCTENNPSLWLQVLYGFPRQVDWAGDWQSSYNLSRFDWNAEQKMSLWIQSPVPCAHRLVGRPVLSLIESCLLQEGGVLDDADGSILFVGHALKTILSLLQSMKDGTYEQTILAIANPTDMDRKRWFRSSSDRLRKITLHWAANSWGIPAQMFGLFGGQPSSSSLSSSSSTRQTKQHGVSHEIDFDAERDLNAIAKLASYMDPETFYWSWPIGRDPKCIVKKTKTVRGFRLSIVGLHGFLLRQFLRLYEPLEFYYLPSGGILIFDCGKCIPSEVCRVLRSLVS